MLSKKNFLDAIERMSKDEYIPEINDIMLSKSVDVEDTKQITIQHKSNKIRIVVENNNWNFPNEVFDLLIIFVPLSDYDKTNSQGVKNIETVLNLQSHFKKPFLAKLQSLVIVFNKEDIMDAKIKNLKNFRTFWPDFPANKDHINVDDVYKYFQQKFNDAYAHLCNSFLVLRTVTTDNIKMEVAFKSILDFVASEKALRDTGF